jgi:transcription elongation factor Elf1
VLALIKKHTVCKKQRLFFTCPECNTNIVMDGEVFKNNTKEIKCEVCKVKYVVFSILSDDKKGISVNLLKQKEI